MFDLPDFNDPFTGLILPSFMKLLFHIGKKKMVFEESFLTSTPGIKRGNLTQRATLKETVKAATYKI